jgi:hypothetical protein
MLDQMTEKDKALLESAKYPHDIYCQGLLWEDVPSDFHETSLGKFLDEAVLELEKVDFYEMTSEGKFKNLRVVNGLGFLDPLGKDNRQFVAYDIDWVVTKDELKEVVEDISDATLSKFGMNPALFRLYGKEEQVQEILDRFYKKPEAGELVGLPTKVGIPIEIREEPDITAWLADTYGNDVKNYSLKLVMA